MSDDPQELVISLLMVKARSRHLGAFEFLAPER